MANQDFSLLLSAFPKAASAEPQSSGGSVTDIINAAAEKEGLPPELLQRIAGVESGGKAGAKNPNSSAEGLFQFIDSTWTSMGGKPEEKKDPVKNAEFGAKFVRQNAEALTKSLGRNPTYGEIYAAHMFGSGVAPMLAEANPTERIEQGLARFESPERVKLILQQNPQLRGQTVGQVLSSFEKKMGGGTAQQAPSFSNVRPLATDRTATEAVTDNLLGAGAGVVTGAKLIADAFGANNPVSSTLDSASKALTDSQSQYRKDQRTERAIAIKQAEQSGSTWEEIKANVAGFAEAPLETTLNALGTSAPTLLMSVIPGLGQAQAARLILQGAMGATQGAGAAKGSIYEAVYNQLVQSGMSKDDASKAAAGAQAYDSENGGMIAANAILGSIAGTSGIEAVAGRLAGRKGGEAASRGIVGRTAMGVVKESPVEGAQGGTERATSNVALQNEGFDVPTMQGVAGQAAGEALASAPGGAVFGALDRPALPPQLQPVADKAAEPNSPLSKAALAGATAQGVLQQATAVPPEGTAPAADPISGRVAAAEQVIRDAGVLEKLRGLGPQMGAENLTNDFLYALQVARNPNSRPDQRQAAIDQVEQAIQWTQTGYTPGATPQPKQPGTAVAVRPDSAVGPVGQAQFFDPNVVDVDAVRVDNMLPGPRALPGPRPLLQGPAGQEQAAPEAADVSAPSEQQTVAPQTETIKNPEGQKTPAGTGPAALRRRSQTIQQLVDQGFETVERRDGEGFFLKNSKTGAEIKLDGMADAALARNLIQKSIRAQADQSPNSPRNDLPESTEGQNKAGNYKKPPVSLNGFTIRVENPAGSVRRGVDKDGVQWESEMKSDYGYIEGTKAKDGDGVDVVIGNRSDSGKIFVIDQVNEDGSFDEPKVVMGVTDEDHARRTYLSNYEPGWQGLGAITEMTREQFNDWLKNGGPMKATALGGKQQPAKQQAPEPQGNFKTLEEAEAYLSAQRRANGSVSGLPLQLPDGSFGIAIKGTPQFAVAQGQRSERAKAEGKDKQGDFFTVKDGGRPKKLKRVKKSELPKKASSARRLGEPRALTQDEASLIEQIASVLGKRVVFFEAQDGRIGDGFFDPSQPDVLFVASETTVNPLAVFGHEFFHDLRETNPEAWNAIAAVVRTRVADPKGFRADYYGDTKAEQRGNAALSEEKGGELEELVSDLGGNLMMDATFWRDVFAKIREDNGAESKGIIARLAAALEQFVARVVNAMKQGGFRADDFVTDLGEVRKAYRDGLADYIKAAGLRQTTMAAEVAKAKQDLLKTPDRAAQPGALTVEGYHFSQQPRVVLTTGMFGTGLKGSARDEIMNADDARLRQRLYFYVNKGTGINPEAGVGAYAHKATLTNIYDADADPLRLRSGNARAFESKVLDSGFSGYLSRQEGTQSGQVILLGSQTVKPQLLGAGKVTGAKVVPAPQQRDQDFADRLVANKALPSGMLSPQRWSQVLMAQDPELAAQLLDIGAFEGGQAMYKDELAAKVRQLTSGIRKSADRAKQEFAEVEAKYKGTDKWLIAPNGAATNLTPRQWVQVRTPSFKKWFGDWEKHATAENPVGSLWSDDTVSKAVDENGEPLVVYHGTDKGGFTEFEQPGGSARGDLGIWTTPNYGMARSYVRRGRARDVELTAGPSTREELEALGFTFFEQDDGTLQVDTPSGYTETYDNEQDAVKDLVENYAEDIDENGAGTQPGIYALFINVKNPNEDNFEGALWNGDRVDQYQVRDESDEPVYDENGRSFFDLTTAERLAAENPGAEVQPADPHYNTTDDVVREALKYNDGAIIREVIDDGGGPGYDMEPSDIFVAFDPLQVKSADYNNGEFSDSTGDLRKSAPRKAAKRPAQDPAIGDKTDVPKLPEGKSVPAEVAVGGLESSLKQAGSKSYRRGRELKQDIQDRVLAAAKAARVNLSARTKATFRFLADMVIADAKFALKSNENAVGWYDQKVSRAIGALSTVHPEIESDPRSRLAFLWALATTSNGVEVGDNFRLAEKAYRGWKATGQMPTDIGIGNAASNINKGLALYNELTEKVGDERLLKFMSTKFTVGQVNSMLGIKPGGEWMDTPVRGAAILGPKIGNGFFSNLNGYFDALTMDRWLMRTWGRMTGTLLINDPAAIAKGRKELYSAIKALSAKDRRTLSDLIGKPVKATMTKAELDAVAIASQKASMKPEKREVMMASPLMDKFRKTANNHQKAMDGQKEAPAGPAERNWIRAVFQDALEQLRADGKDMTMSDLQALLWYPERRLYDAAKADEEIEAGYEDDEAPDYANAALELALANGVSKTRVLAAMDAAEARGTVVGKPLTDAEKQAMLDEFRKPPEQQFQIAFEAAPNPDDEVATAAWNRLTDKDKKQITELARDAVLADMIDAVGLKVGKGVTAMGGFESQINPNVIAGYKPTQVGVEDARALAAAVGIALEQKSVALIDSRASKTNGLIRITLPSKAEKHVRTIMGAIAANLGVTDFTARGNNIDILNFTKQPTEELAGKIEQVLDGIDSDLEASVSFGDVNSELVEEGSYESQITGARPETGREILERARRARARAREIIGAELRARSPGQVSDGAGNARRGADEGDIRRSAARDGSGRQKAGRAASGSLEASEQAAAQALKPLPGAPTVQGATGPDPKLVSVAERYARDNGIQLRRQAEYVKADPQRGKRIADAYAAMAHDPQNPRVKEAYQNLIKQTRAQYDALVDAGYKFWFMDMNLADNQEYASSPWNAMRDLRANQEMGVFPTESGFGSSEDFTPDSNPLLADTGLRWPVGGANSKRTAPVLANDLFRAVHDAFGHGLEGAGFRADGEENAWQAHVRLFTGSAVAAITSETRGQNSWLNFGPNGETNRTAKVEDTVFADQKTGLMPEWTWKEGVVGDMPTDANTSYNQRVAALKDLIACLKK